MRRSLPVSLLSVLAVVVTSCGGGASSPAPSAPGPSTPAGTAAGPTTTAAPTTAASTTTAPRSAALGEDLAAVVNEGRTAVQERIDADGRAFDLVMADATGMTAALGGPDATRAAFEAHYAELERIARAFAPPTGPARGRPGAPLGFTVGGGFTAQFAAAFTAPIAAQAAIAATKDGPVHGATSDISIDGDIGHVSTSWEATNDTGAVTGGVKVKIELNPCPDTDGVVNAHIEVTSSAVGGGLGGAVRGTADLTGHVDDDADLVGTDIDSSLETTEWQTSGASASHYAGTMGATLDGSGQVVGSLDVDLTAAEATGAVNPGSFGSSLALTIIGISLTVMNAAKDAWQSGRCVRIDDTTSPSERTGLEPEATFTIEAKPRSKVDGGATGGTVQATLSGGSAVTPSGKVKADATFDYVAPQEKEKVATVTLEARSRRGAARRTIDFDTRSKSYRYDVDLEGMTGYDYKCAGLTGRWTTPLTGAAKGFEFDAVLTIDIGEDLTGTTIVTWTWKGQGGSGSGTVTGPAVVDVAPDGASGTITLGPLSGGGTGVLQGQNTSGGAGGTYSIPFHEQTYQCP